MLRALIIAALVTAPTTSIIPISAAAAAEPSQCTDTPAKKARRSIFGGIAGSIAGNVLGRSGVPTSVVGVYLPVGSLLSDAILKLLDCKEQQQAAKATNEALRGGVGSEVAWK